MKSNSSVRVAEDELHAYVDGLLPPDDRGRVESYLSAFPHERERIEAYRRQNVHLHRLFDWYMRRPNAGDFDSLAERYARRVRRARRLRAGFRVAALAGVVFVSGSFGWMGYSWFGAAERARGDFIQQAVEAHFLSEAGAGDRVAAIGYGAPELLERMATDYEAMPRQAPDFRDAGFDLVGGRVIPTGYGPAVQFLYVNENGHRVSLFMGRSRSSAGQFQTQTLVGDEKLLLIHRQTGGLSYSLIGNVERATMFAMADLVSVAIETPAPLPRKTKETTASDEGVEGMGSVLSLPKGVGTSVGQTKPVRRNVPVQQPHPNPNVREASHKPQT